MSTLVILTVKAPYLRTKRTKVTNTKGQSPEDAKFRDIPLYGRPVSVQRQNIDLSDNFTGRGIAF
jgi:hypothetical protein